MPTINTQRKPSRNMSGKFVLAGATSGAATGAQYGGAVGAIGGAIVGATLGGYKGKKATKEAKKQDILQGAAQGDFGSMALVATNPELQNELYRTTGIWINSPQQAEADLKAQIKAGTAPGQSATVAPGWTQAMEDQRKGLTAKQSYEMDKIKLANKVGMFDYMSGINIGQATVQGGSNANVSVPSGQQGSGIWSALTNLAAGAVSSYLNKPSQLQPAVTGNLVPSNQTGGIPLGGGVVLVGSGSIGTPVTTNTTSGGYQQSSSSGMMALLIGVVVVVLLMLSGGLKKLFK